MYTVTPYYLSKIVGEFPVQAFTPILFAVITYFGLGLTASASQFFYHYLILFLLTQSAASFGYFMSSIFNKEETAVGVAPTIVMPIILFGGQFANAGNIQKWISWLQYISPIRYSFEAIIINEYDSRIYDITKGEVNPKIFMGFDVGMWKCLVILTAITIGLRIFSLIFLKLLVSKFQ